MGDYSKLTDDQFDTILSSILDKMTGASILSVRGAYELFAEHFNNEVLEIWDEQQENPCHTPTNS